MSNPYTLALKGIALCIAIFLSAPLFSQKKIFTGYFIGAGGDTVKGTFPEYSQWSKSPEKVTFLATGTASNTQLTPENCSTFSIDGFDTYIAYRGKRMTNPITFDIAVNNKNFIGIADNYDTVTTFLRLVTEVNNRKLLVLSDKKRMNFFVKDNNLPAEELRFKMYFSDDRVHEIRDYKQQLKAYFSAEIESKNLVGQLERLPYKEEYLADFFEKLGPAKVKTKVKDPASGIIVMAGATLNSFKVTGDKTVFKVNTNFNSSVSPLLSVGYMLPISRNFNKFFLMPSLKVYSYKNEGSHESDGYNRETIYKASMILSGGLNVGINLINGKETKVFVSAGGGMIYLLKHKEVINYKRGAENNTYSTLETVLPNLTYNVNISAGVMLHNKIMLLGTYTLPTTIGNFMYYKPQLSSIQIGVGYKL